MTDDDGEAATIREVPKARKTPRERFKEVAPRRTQKVLDALRLLGRCGNKVTYGYERDEVKKIFDAVDRELARARARFDDNEATQFKL